MASLKGLGQTKGQSTRLGFGCSGLMGKTNRAASLKLLQVAFEAGIRHFDVAPMYGYGEAEACLGQFVANHRHEVTVATKFGVASSTKPRFNFVKQFTRGIVSRLPSLRARLERPSAGATSSARTVPFTAAVAEHSLERSLRSLRTDHIDLWLMHEVKASDLQDAGLLRFLEDAVKSGKVGTFGVGSESQNIPELLKDRHDYCRVLQFEWSIFDAILAATPQFRVHHRSLTERFLVRHAELTNDGARCRAWSTIVDRNLRDRSKLAGLMLRASLECNPQSIILFSSTSPNHVRENVRISRDQSLREPALLLQQLAHRLHVENSLKEPSEQLRER